MTWLLAFCLALFGSVSAHLSDIRTLYEARKNLEQGVEPAGVEEALKHLIECNREEAKSFLRFIQKSDVVVYGTCSERLKKALFPNAQFQAGSRLLVHFDSGTIDLSNISIDDWMLEALEREEPSIKVIYTSAHLEGGRWSRRRSFEYRKTLDALNRFGIYPYIVEAIKLNVPYFNLPKLNTFYVESQDNRYLNKGVHEMRSLRAAAELLPFHDDDMVIKITGRYCPFSPHLLDTIRAHPNAVAFAHYCFPISIFSGYFALRWKDFKRVVMTTDLEKMERERLFFENIFTEPLLEMECEGEEVVHMDRLDIDYCFAGLRRHRGRI